MCRYLLKNNIFDNNKNLLFMKPKILILAFGLMSSLAFSQSAKVAVVKPVPEVAVGTIDNFVQNVSLTVVQFDTQDNLFLKDFDCHNWQNQGGLDEGEAINQFSARRLMYKGVDAVKFRTTAKSKKIFLNNYPYFYKVKKINEREFIAISKKFNQYFDNTDIIEALIFQ